MGPFERWFGRKSRREQQRREEQARYQQRLLAPHWDEVESVLGRPVPALLRNLYADRELVTSADFFVLDPARSGSEEAPLNVDRFIPADKEAFTPGLVSIPPGAFAFATNEYGDPLYVQLGELADGDGRVFVHYHDGDDTEAVAPSLQSLLSWPRTPRPHRDPAI
jgi:hypothetical protein